MYAEKFQTIENFDIPGIQLTTLNTDYSPESSHDKSRAKETASALLSLPDKRATGNNEQRIYADDKDVIPVCLQRTSDGFGFNFVGPETTDSMTGVFITKVCEGGPAWMSQHIQRGQQILAINGQDTILATKYDVHEMLLHAPSVLLEVKYDPEGFSVYDQGNELRQVSLHAFAGSKEDEIVETHSCHYLGCTPVIGTSATVMQQAYQELKKNPNKLRRQKMFMGIGRSEIRVFPARKNTESNDVQQHILLDVVNCASSSNVLAFVSGDIVNQRRQMMCHVYTLRTKRVAASLCEKIKAQCDDGFLRVRNQLSRTRAQSISTARRRASVAAAAAARHSRRSLSISGNRNANSTNKSSDCTTERNKIVADGAMDFRSVPLQEQCWFSPRLSQADAIKMLAHRAPVGGYVVLPSGRPQEFDLLIKEGPRDIRGLRIMPQVDNGQICYTLEGSTQVFENVVSLIWHFSHEPYLTMGNIKYMLRLPRLRQKKSLSDEQHGGNVTVSTNLISSDIEPKHNQAENIITNTSLSVGKPDAQHTVNIGSNLHAFDETTRNTSSNDKSHNLSGTAMGCEEAEEKSSEEKETAELESLLKEDERHST
eukprot:gene3671-8337_t